MVTTLAGNNVSFGAVDGVGIAARFLKPQSVAVNTAGVIYVADSRNNLIRAIVVASRVVTKLAGGAGGTVSGSLNGIGSAATFSSPYGVAFNGAGTLFVADVDNNLIRAIDVTSRVVSTLAGGGSAGGTANGTANGVGSAARFLNPIGVAADGAGNLFVTDTFRVRAIVVATRNVTTLAGSPTAGRADGVGTAANFQRLFDIAVDGGIIYVADINNHLIRSIVAATGVVGTLAGGGSANGAAGGYADGFGSAALFFYPGGVAADNAGNVYVADTYSNRVRAIVVATRLVTTLAGGPGLFADGIGTAAAMGTPYGVAVDSARGVIYVSDDSKNVIRAICPTLAPTSSASTSSSASRSRSKSAAASSSRSRAPSVTRSPTRGLSVTATSSPALATVLPTSCSGLSIPLAGAYKSLWPCNVTVTISGGGGGSGNSDFGAFGGNGANFSVTFFSPPGLIWNATAGAGGRSGSISGGAGGAASGIFVPFGGIIVVAGGGGGGNALPGGAAGPPNGVATAGTSNGPIIGGGGGSQTAGGVGGTTAHIQAGVSGGFGPAGGGAGGNSGYGAVAGGAGFSPGGGSWNHWTAGGGGGGGFYGGGGGGSGDAGYYYGASGGGGSSFLNASYARQGTLSPVTYIGGGAPMSRGATGTIALNAIACAMPSVTQTPSVSFGASRSLTPSRMPSPSVSPSRTASRSASRSARASATRSSSQARSLTRSRSASTSPAASTSRSPTRGLSVTATVSRTRSASASVSSVPSPSRSPTRGLSVTRTVSRSRSAPASASRAASPSRSPTRGLSVTATASRSQSRVGSPSRSATASPRVFLSFSNGTNPTAIGTLGGSTYLAPPGGCVVTATITGGGGGGGFSGGTGGGGAQFQVTFFSDGVTPFTAQSATGGSSGNSNGGAAGGGAAAIFTANAIIAVAGGGGGGNSFANGGGQAGPPGGAGTAGSSNGNIRGGGGGTQTAGGAAGLNTVNGPNAPLAGAGAFRNSGAGGSYPGFAVAQPGGNGWGVGGLSYQGVTTGGGGGAGYFGGGGGASGQGSYVPASGGGGSSFVNFSWPLAAFSAVAFAWVGGGAVGAAGGAGSVILNSCVPLSSTPSVSPSRSPSSSPSQSFGSTQTNTASRSRSVSVSVSRAPSPSPACVPGLVTTLAGRNRTAGAANGVGTASTFSNPWGISFDGVGRIYVADAGNNLIRVIDVSTRAVTTLAGGNGTTQSGSADGVGTAATFSNPRGVAVDGQGNLFVSDYGNKLIRVVAVATGSVTTIAGGAGRRTSGSADGVGIFATFSQPYGVSVDGSGRLFVADTSNRRIRAIVVATGVVTTLAGNGTISNFNGIGSAATFRTPYDVAADRIGNVYVADDNLVRAIVVATGVVTTLAGGGSAGGTASGNADGVGSAALFNVIYGVSVSYSGSTVYVAENGGRRIRTIDVATRTVRLLAGGISSGPFTDGVGTAATGWGQLFGVAVDNAGVVYASDVAPNHIIRVVCPTTVPPSASPSASTSASASASQSRAATPSRSPTRGLSVTATVSRMSSQSRSASPSALVSVLSSCSGVRYVRLNNTRGATSMNFVRNAASFLLVRLFRAELSHRYLPLPSLYPLMCRARCRCGRQASTLR
jgi:sugar lactone lactonase YvrE